MHTQCMVFALVPGLATHFIRERHTSRMFARVVSDKMFSVGTLCYFATNPYLLNGGTHRETNKERKKLTECDNFYSLQLCVRDYHLYALDSRQSARRCASSVRPSNGCEIISTSFFSFFVNPEEECTIFPPNLLILV